jgi:glycosyltransferase involved in cell wall biosynthesis
VLFSARSRGCILKYSIIIPCFNYDKYLGRAIRSALNQTYQDVEVIVVNDCSTDASRFIAEAFGRDVYLINLEQNGGISNVRNLGAIAATGQYITFLDADDLLHKDFVSVSMLHHEFNNKVIMAHDYFIIDDKEEHIERRTPIINPIIGGMSMLTQLVIDNKFNTKVDKEDEDFIWRVGGHISYSRIPLYRYRRHDNNMSRQAHDEPLIFSEIGKYY